MSCTAGPRPPNARGGPSWRVRGRSRPAAAVWGCAGSGWRRKRRRHPSGERANPDPPLALKRTTPLLVIFSPWRAFERMAAACPCLQHKAPRGSKDAGRGANDVGALVRCGDDGVLVVARAHAAVGEDAVVGDPLEGLFVHLLGVGLEHEALARTPAARVHHGVVTRREFVFVVVGIAIG